MRQLLERLATITLSSLFISMTVWAGATVQGESAAADTLFFEGPAGTAYEMEASGNVKAGFGVADITPDWPVLLPYGRQEPTDEYFDRTKVKVLMLQVGGVQVAWLVFDMIGLDAERVHIIKKEIGRATGMDPRHLIVSGTHNHSYPHTRTASDRLVEFITGKAVTAVQKAMDSLFEARIGFGKTHTRGDLNLNRAEVHGPANTRLYTIRIEDEDGHLRGVQYNYGTHPTMFTEWGDTQGQIGPNFPGYVSHYIENRIRLDLMYKNYDEKLGIDTDPFVMFSEGAAGDQQPRLSNHLLNGKRTPAQQVFMENLGREVLRSIEKVETRSEVDLRFSSRVVKLTRRTGEPYPTLLQAMVINDAALFTMPGEYGSSLGYKLEELSPYEKSMVASVTNDYIGYIVREKLALEQVTYQSKSERFTPDFSRTLIAEAIGMVRPGFSADDESLQGPEVSASISGHVAYEGDQAVAIGAKRRTARPNYGGGFFGKRTVVNEDGSWKIEELAPGTFYLYLVEADAESPGPDGLRSDHRDVRNIFYGYPVKVREGESVENLNFSVLREAPSHNISGLKLNSESLSAEGSALRGQVMVNEEGRSEAGPDPETRPVPAGAEVRAYPAHHPYKWREVFLKTPVESTTVEQDGTFYLTGLPPGDYQIVCFYDVNNNQLVEYGIDVISSYTDSPVIRIGEEGDSRILYH